MVQLKKCAGTNKRKMSANSVYAVGANGASGFSKFSFFGSPSGCLVSDSVTKLAEETGAYWLITAILSYRGVVQKEPFQVWELKHIKPFVKVNADGSGSLFRDSYNLTCDDGNGVELVKQFIEFSDFPYKSVKLYMIDNDTLIFPSEY